MAPPHLSFVFGDGSRATVACDSGTLTRICGPVLAPLLDDADGTHLDVPELDDLDHAAPLLAFLRKHVVGPASGDVTKPAAVACYRAAAERLDIPEFVLAVERALIRGIATGDVTLDLVTKAYAGCPRVQAICAHYLVIPGALTPPAIHTLAPDVYDLADLVDRHGALFIVVRFLEPPYFRFYIVASEERCAEVGREQTHAAAAMRRLSSKMRAFGGPREYDEGYTDVPGDVAMEKRAYTLFRSTQDVDEYAYLLPRRCDTWRFDVRDMSCMTCRPLRLVDLVMKEEESCIIMLTTYAGRKLVSTSKVSEMLYDRGFKAAFPPTVELDAIKYALGIHHG
jgi:hypothetical protein